MIEFTTENHHCYCCHWALGIMPNGIWLQAKIQWLLEIYSSFFHFDNNVCMDLLSSKRKPSPKIVDNWSNKPVICIICCGRPFNCMHWQQFMVRHCDMIYTNKIGRKPILYSNGAALIISHYFKYILYTNQHIVTTPLIQTRKWGSVNDWFACRLTNWISTKSDRSHKPSNTA